MEDKSVKEILKKYSNKLSKEIGETPTKNQNFSRDFLQFKQDTMPELSRYEKWAKGLGNLIKLKIASKDEKRIQKELDIAHLDVNPGEVIGLAISGFLIMFIIGSLISLIGWLVFSSFPLLFFILNLLFSFFVFYYFYTIPSRIAIKWKLKASSQMVPAILYTVVYMKHTSNLERAISFVTRHIEEPLALDLKKVVWDVETGRFSNIKESLDNYLKSWREDNMEFIESFHLIESSLYEPNEARRIQILERALKVMLDGVYEIMLKYTHDIKSPLTNLYMLGIVLPTLGLALLPLASTLLGGFIKWSHVFILFNLIIPFFVFYLTSQVVLKRPGGYGETSLLKKNPLYSEYKSNSIYFTAFAICFPFFLIGILPLLFGYTSLPSLLGLPSDFSIPFLSTLFGNEFFYFADGKGPFGVGAVILSLFIPFSISMFFSISLSMKTKKLIKIRDESKGLEKEFASSLFTLGNRLGDGVPAEIAFSRVAESSKGQKTEEFFKIVSSNIRTMGMSLEEAIFNSRRGALIYYPSHLIATSMRILIESSKKGLKVAAESLMSISDYLRNINKINERLRDLLAEVSSDMKSNMSFLAPLLAGIVIGLATMITGILGRLKELVGQGLGEQTIGGFGNIGSIVNLFDISNLIPPYYLQIAIGIYIIEIIYILTSTLVIVDSGEDKLKTSYEISKNLIRGSVLYLIVSLISIIALSFLAGIALRGIS